MKRFWVVSVLLFLCLSVMAQVRYPGVMQSGPQRPGTRYRTTAAVADTTNYYVASSGNDANSGHSTSSPWKSIAKLNAATLEPGDSVFFNKGDVFDGALSITPKGTAPAPIVVTSYGSGVRPTINGDLSGVSWTATPGHTGTYQAYVGTGSLMASIYERYDGAWNALTKIADAAGTRSAWLDSLGSGEWGPGTSTDTVWFHKHDSTALNLDSLRFTRLGNFVNDGSKNAVIRDIAIRSFSTGLDLSHDTSITVRRIAVAQTDEQGIYLRTHNDAILVDSCTIDSTGNDGLYNYLSTNSIFRADTVKNVLAEIRGVAQTGDQCGVGLQASESDTFDVVGNNTVEYCYFDNIKNFAIDYYWNQQDTVRYNTGVNLVGGGISPHGTNLVVKGNVMTVSDGGNGITCANVGAGTISITNNRLNNIYDYGLKSVSDSGGTTTFSADTVVTSDAGLFVDFGTAGNASTGNRFYGASAGYRKAAVVYLGMLEFKCASGFESGSLHYDSLTASVDPISADSVYAVFLFESTNRDTSGRGFHLTNTGSSPFVTGKLDTAINFDGERAEWSTNADMIVDSSTSWTVGGWWYYSSGAYAAFISTAGATVTSGWYVWRNADDGNKLSLTTVDRGEAHTATITTDTAATGSLWYFLAIQYDSATDTVSIQVNNGTVYKTKPSYLPGISAQFVVGRKNYDGTSLAYYGYVDDLFVFKRKMTAAELTWIYNAGSGRAWTEW